MTRDEYLRQISESRRTMRDEWAVFRQEVNPLTHLRRSVRRDWRWWLPGAALAGFGASLVTRLRGGRPRAAGKAAQPAAGKAFWIPLILKWTLPLAGQIVTALVAGRMADDAPRFKFRLPRN